MTDVLEELKNTYKEIYHFYRLVISVGGRDLFISDYKRLGCFPENGETLSDHGLACAVLTCSAKRVDTGPQRTRALMIIGEISRHFEGRKFITPAVSCNRN